MNCYQRLLTTISVFSIALLISTTGSATDRVALLIGNGDYNEKGAFGDLDNPVEDVILVSDALTKSGFKVILVKDASKREMQMKLREFEEAIKPGGTAVFYFAGHGIQHNGENFLIGTNAEFKKEYELTDEAIKANMVLDALAYKKPKTALVFLDCCRERPPAEWLASTRGVKTRGLSEISHNNRNLLISYAAAPHMPALDGESSNSPFARALSSEILKKDVELSRVLKNVANTVHTETAEQQTPWWNGSLMHDFFFNKKGETPKATYEIPSFAADASTIEKSEGSEWTLFDDGKITTSEGIASTKSSIVAANPASLSTTDYPADAAITAADAPPTDLPPLTLPSRGYFSNEEVFENSSYSEYNSTSRRKILKAAQGKLSGAGTPDGAMGGNTQTAIVSYQEANKLPVTGKLDRWTIDALQLNGMKEEAYTASSSKTRSYKSNSGSRSNYRSRSSGNGQDLGRAIGTGLSIYRAFR